MISLINQVPGILIMEIEWGKVKNYLKENPQIKEEIDRKLREKLGIFDGDVDENENEDDSPKLYLMNSF